MTTPRVSIVLLTRNGMATLPAVFDALWQQHVAGAIEIVAVDSGSTDGTLEFLRQHAQRVLSIPVAEFDHGATRNLGIAQSSAELVVLLVQDAVPASDQWLVELMAPLLADERVAGSFARQQPRPDASAITRFYQSRWIAASTEPRTATLASLDELEALTPMDRLWRCAFDDVCSCIRRSVWQAHPFRPAPIAEDLEWAREVLVHGYRLVYAPAAVVTHSHERSALYEFRRTYVLHGRLGELFGLQTIPTFGALARAVGSSAKLHLRSGPKRPATVARALALAVAWPLGQYLGGQAAMKGRKVRGFRPGTV